MGHPSHPWRAGGLLQDLEQLLEAGWPLWGNAMALESFLSNKLSLSSPDTDPLLAGTHLRHSFIA